jgi:hypothetical protein
MLMLVPSEPLAPGAYSMELDGVSVGAIIYVNKSAVLRTRESDGFCFDREFSVGLGGGERLIPCGHSTLKEGTYCGPGAQREGRCSSAGASQAGSGVPKVGANTAKTSAADLEGQLAALTQRQPGAPHEFDKTYAQQDRGVSFAYPASWELFEETGVLVATIAEPGEGLTLSDRTQISLTKSVAGKMTLDEVVAETVTGTRNTLSNADIAGPVRTQMAGADARVFFVTGTEAGKYRQKAVTVAVSGGTICGAVLHATPDTFESVWDAYLRVKDSYKVEEASFVIR